MESIDDDVALSFTEDGFDAQLLEEFAVDLSLSEVDRIERYVFSDVEVQRLVHVKLLRDYITVDHIETIKERILPLLETIASDKIESIRIELCHVMQKLVYVFAEEDIEDGCELAGGLVVPLLWSMVEQNCETTEIQEAYADCLCSIVRVLPEDFSIENILPPVIECSHSNNESQQIFACLCISKICSTLSPTANSDYFLPEISVLLSVGSISVLKMIPTILSALAGHVDILCEECLVSLYIQCMEHRLWLIRKEAIRMIYEFTKELNEKEQCRMLQLLLVAIDDKSKWVRQQAKERLGYILTCIDKKYITENVLNAYISIPDALEETEDFLLTYSCAYTFPAVLCYLGKDYWTLFRSFYRRLCTTHIIAIQHTLAASLGEIANCLNSDDVEKDLYSNFISFLNDDTADVVMAALTALPTFFKHMDISHQIEIGQTVYNICNKLKDNTYNWRVQVKIGEELNNSINCVCSDVLTKSLISVIHQGVNDQTSSVRNQFKLCEISLFKRLSQDKMIEIKQEVDFICNLQKESYYKREMCTEIIREILPCVINDEEERLQLVDCMNLLLKDSIINVKEMAIKSVQQWKEDKQLWDVIESTIMI